MGVAIIKSTTVKWAWGKETPFRGEVFIQRIIFPFYWNSTNQKKKQKTQHPLPYGYILHSSQCTHDTWDTETKLHFFHISVKNA